MTSSLISRSLGRPLTARATVLAALCGALLLAVLVALPAPAQAHDTLLESDPADGDTLETSPEDITLTFSADILDVSPLVRISDESGEQVAEITPSIEGPVATATLPEQLPAGTYSVQWRVVSSDGHPIEDTFTLTVEQGPESAAPSDEGGAQDEGTQADGAQGEGAEDGAGEEAPAEESSAAAEEPADAEEGGSAMTVLIVVVAVVVVGAVVAGALIMRRRD